MKPSRLLLAFLFATASVAYCANLTWDASLTTTAAQDGAGTWNAASTNWWNGTANAAFATGDNLTFGAATGTTATYGITLDGSFTAGNVTFGGATSSFARYTVDLGGNTLTVNGTLTSYAQVDSNYTILANGTVALRKTGSTAAAPDFDFDPNDGIDWGTVVTATVDVGAGNRYFRGAPQRNDLNRYAGDLRLSGPLTGSANLFFAGTTTDSGHNMHFVLNAANPGFTGAVTINGNADVELTNDAALSSANDVNLAPPSGVRGALFLYGRSVTIGNLLNTGVGTSWIRNGAQNAANGGTGTSTSGGSIPLGVNADSVLTITQSVDSTFNGIISDGPNDNGGGTGSNFRTLGLVKNGAASLTLTGANTYSGGTTVNAGAFHVKGAFATTAPLTLNGGSFQFSSGANPIGSLTVSALTQSGGALGVDFSGTSHDLVTVNGNYASTGGSIAVQVSSAPATGTPYPVVNYTGTLTGAPAVTFSGLEGSRLTGSVDYGTGTASSISVTFNGTAGNLTWKGLHGSAWDFATKNWDNGGSEDFFFQQDSVTFDDTGISSPNPVLDEQARTGTVLFNNNSGTYTLTGSGGIAGGDLIKVGMGTAILATNNTYAGTTTISGGVLQVGNGGTIGSLGSGALTNNASLVFNRSDSFTYPSAISGTGSLTQSGTGTATVGGSVTQVGSDPGAGDIMALAGTLAISGDVTQTTGNIIALGNLTLGGNVTQESGIFSSSGTTVVTGNLNQTNNLTIPSGTFSIGNGGTTGTVAATVPIACEGGLIVNRSSAVTLASTLTGGGTLTKLGAGALTLTSDNQLTGGTFLTGGTLAFATPAVLGPVSVTLGGGTTLNVANNEAVSMTVPVVLAAPGTAQTITLVKNTASIGGGTQTDFAAGVSGGNANVTLFVNTNTTSDNTTTARFGTANTFRATVNLNRGGIVVGHAQGLGDAANLIYLNGNVNNTLGDLRFELPMVLPNPVQCQGTAPISTNEHAVEFTGVVSGGGTLTKLGTGSLTLSNALNTHTGTVGVSAGSLVVNGNIATGTNAVNVGAAGTLAGTGVIARPVNVTGTLSPGNGIGGLTVSNTLTFAANSTYEFQLGDWTGAAGTGYDTMTVNAAAVTATSAGKFTVHVDASALANFTEGSKTFVLATGAAPATGVVADNWTVTTTGFTGAGTWKVQASGNTLQLVYSFGTDAFAGWVDGFTSLPIDQRDPLDDFDSDGVNNLLEFVLGGNPTASNSAVLPAPQKVGNDFVVTFRRSQLAKGYGTLTLQHSPNLKDWTDVTIGNTGSGVVSITDQAPAADIVTVTIPAGSNDRMFARLKIAQP